MKLVSTSCINWEDRLEASQIPISDEVLAAYAFNDEAERWARVYRALPISDIGGNPTNEDLSPDAPTWIELAFRCLAGSFDPETGERAIRELFLLVPKKSGKSFSTALAMLATMLTARDKPNHAYTIISPTLQVSNLSYRAAADAASLHPDIGKIMRTRQHVRDMTNLRTGSTLKVIPASPKSVVGMRGSAIVDELHALAEASANSDRVMAQITGALVSDPSDFVVYISTQSERPPKGVFRDMLNRARAVRDGTHADGTLLPVLFEPPQGADLEDEKIWRMVNPGLGSSVSIERLRAGHSAAVASGPAALQLWRSQHLNAETKIGAVGDIWKAAALWPAALDPAAATVDRAELLRRKVAEADLVVVGVDAGGLWDSAALAILCRSSLTGNYYADAFGYVTEHGINADNAAGVFYRDMIATGDVAEIQPGGDVADMGARVAHILATGTEVLAGLDPWQVTDVQSEFLALGMPESAVVGVRQGVGLSSAIDQLERLLGSKTITHSGSPYLAACLGNVVITERGKARAIEKAAPSRKIDAAAALLSALFVMIHGADDGDVEAIDPWTDPNAAAAVWAGDNPVSSYPPDDPVEGDAVAIA